ncbi:MAG: hypothetical protein RL111_411 [Pseudomonadota bacterium]|jgi:hypothetical protein
MTPFRLALALLALCIVAIWQVSLIPESLMQMAVGPTLVPKVVVAGLTVLALIYGFRAHRGLEADESLAEDQSPLPGSNTRALSLMLGGVAFMALVGPLGFIAAGTACGMGVARAFDAPLGSKSLLICALLSTLFWVLFAVILGVGLGPGLPWLI